VSACDIWAVGGNETANGGFRTLIEHWTGGANWKIEPSPSPGDVTGLSAVSALSATNIWAVGVFVFDDPFSGGGLVVHWDGSSWTQVPAPLSAGAPLRAVAAVSASDVWVAGLNIGGPVMLQHYDGTNWTQPPLPSLTPPAAGSPDLDLTGLAGTSGSDVWAVGNYTTDGVSTQPLILHWDGSRWSQSQVPSLTAAGQGDAITLTAVSASSPSDAWAVGSAGFGGQTATLHWNGVRWTLVPSPSPGDHINNLTGVTAVSPGSAFAVGSYSNRNGGSPDRSLMLHWDGRTWAQVSSPNPGAVDNDLTAVANGQGGKVWAVGTKSDRPASDAMRTQIAEFGVVPDVVGDTEAVAADAILDAGLGTTTSVVTTPGAGCSPSTNGKVIATSPAVGSFSGPPVTLSVCSLPPPPATVTVPNVSTFDDTSAQNSITAAGLAVGVVSTTPNCAVKAGDVVFQSPNAGVVVARGSAVDLVEASGLGPNKKRCPVL
jgi:hypothetical protein